MKAAELRRRRPEDAEIERLARVYVSEPGSAARVEVLVPEFTQGIESMLAEGVTDDHGRYLTLDDGEDFIEALPTFFHGSRFWAVEIEPEADAV